MYVAFDTANPHAETDCKDLVAKIFTENIYNRRNMILKNAPTSSPVIKKYKTYLLPWHFLQCKKKKMLHRVNFKNKISKQRLWIQIHLFWPASLPLTNTRALPAHLACFLAGAGLERIT